MAFSAAGGSAGGGETGPAFNKYDYNTRSEVVDAVRYSRPYLRNVGGQVRSKTNDTSEPVGLQDWSYSYDNIRLRLRMLDFAGQVGNRTGTMSASGGSAGGGKANDSATYTTNAHYEYSPFGETIVATGELAAENSFRFSTKYFCDEFGMGDWGRRWYSPSMARFANSDPIGQRGGLNVQAFLNNDAINGIDMSGLFRLTGPFYKFGVRTEENPDRPLYGSKWGATLRNYYIDELDVHVSGNNKCCEIVKLQTRLELVVWLPNEGEYIENRYGREIEVKPEIQANIRQHEDLHVEGYKAVADALGGKLETECTGKCKVKSDWNEQTCREWWEQKIRGRVIRNISFGGEFTYIFDLQNRTGEKLHSMWNMTNPRYRWEPDASGWAIYRSYIKSVAEEGKGHTFCDDL